MTAATAAALLPVLAGCGFHSGDSSTSVFAAKVGECFAAPTDVKAQVSDLAEVACSQPHGQEAYALVDYAAAGSNDAYPGDQVLDNFAQGACAQRFGSYVGVDYLDSSYFYTYLAPSPRSWQESDRTVLCLVTDAGKPMVGSVKGAGH